MSEPVFLKRGRGLTVAEIAALAGARAPKATEAQRRIFEIAAHDRAGPTDIVFTDRADHIVTLRTSQAGACLTTARLEATVSARIAALVVDDPYKAFIAVAGALYPESRRPSSLYEVQGHAPTALVHPTARLEAGVIIDPAAVIGPRAEIGGGTVIGAMAVVGPDVRIGRDCVIGIGASIANALIGNRVVVQAGCRIGEPTLGTLMTDPTRNIGRVILQDGVEIGSNSTVDRGGLADTVIGEYTRVDNLMRVPGDVMIGRQCAILAAADGPTDAAPPGTDGELWFADGSRITAAALAAKQQARAVSPMGDHAR